MKKNTEKTVEETLEKTKKTTAAGTKEEACEKPAQEPNQSIETKPSPDDLQIQLDELTDKNLRLMAEFENYKKRTQKEKEASYEFAKADTIGALLPVLDTLELSLTQDATDGNAFKAGIELVVKQFHTALEKAGVKEIPALNEPFDPKLHNAVMREEDGDGAPDTVVEVLQKGYILHDRVIRHSMVKVKA